MCAHPARPCYYSTPARRLRSVTVQLILGHKKIDTTLGFARLYDGTAAAYYYRAMVQIESHLRRPVRPQNSQRPATVPLRSSSGSRC